jgi:hypothetical protein
MNGSMAAFGRFGMFEMMSSPGARRFAMPGSTTISCVPSVCCSPMAEVGSAPLIHQT